MFIVDELAEAHIQKAMERGDFDDLRGAGQPLDLDDDVFVPEELRMAFRILKNAGYAPPEVLLHREIREVEQLLYQASDTGEQTRLSRKLSLLRVRLGDRGRYTSNSRYALKIVRKF